MRDTPTQSIGYHTYNKKILHYPSLPNNPPAVDTGTLRRSITFDVGMDENKVTGRVGSTILDPPYGAYLEFGTSRMIQRPWLRPALERNQEVIKEHIREGVREIVNG
jgi:HK97 gp10 family phage protein